MDTHTHLACSPMHAHTKISLAKAGQGLALIPSQAHKDRDQGKWGWGGAVGGWSCLAQGRWTSRTLRASGWGWLAEGSSVDPRPPGGRSPEPTLPTGPHSKSRVERLQGQHPWRRMPGAQAPAASCQVTGQRRQEAGSRQRVGSSDSTAEGTGPPSSPAWVLAGASPSPWAPASLRGLCLVAF